MSDASTLDNKKKSFHFKGSFHGSSRLQLFCFGSWLLVLAGFRLRFCHRHWMFYKTASI